MSILRTTDPRLPRLSEYLGSLKLRGNEIYNSLIAACDDFGIPRAAQVATSSSQPQPSSAASPGVDPEIQRSWGVAFAAVGADRQAQQGPTSETADQESVAASWEAAFSRAGAASE